MRLSIYQVDAFASEVFRGNPAAVCPLETWLPETTMQATMELDSTNTLNNVADTQRRSLMRDRFVGLVLALGLAVGVVTIESMAAHASQVQKPAAMQPAPFGK